MNTQPPVHFKGKEAITHVAEAQAQGIISSSEIHGTELPGHISAATDAAREVAFILAVSWLILSKLGLSYGHLLGILSVLSGGLVIWKTGRGAWLAWFRLERLHRIVAQEKWEIEHHRQQEREELKALYAAKGFEGKLLEEVLDVLMADGDRLLRVMIEEELGLSLESHEHPDRKSVV
jgi:vacuolar iron transporter family protein